MASNEIQLHRQQEPDKHGRTITFPRPAELFSVNSRFPKRVGIISAVTRLAAVTKATVNEGVHGIYADTLEDLEPSVLARIFEQAERTCKFLPAPAELRELAGIGGPGEALAAWDFLERFIDRHVNGDGRGGYVLREGSGPIQWRDGKAYSTRIPVPELPEAIDRAVRLCGGWSRFKEASDEEYGWLKKEFMAAMASYDAAEIASNRLLGGSTSDIVKQLSAGIKSLPGEVSEPKGVHVLDQVAAWRSEWLASRNASDGGSCKPEPIARSTRVATESMTDEQWEARRRMLREQAAEVQRKYGQRSTGGDA